MMRFLRVNGIWKENGEPAETFPLMAEGNSRRLEVPLAWAEEAYKEYYASFGNAQSLPRLKERGGFGVYELPHLLYRRIKRLIEDLEQMKQVAQIRKEKLEKVTAERDRYKEAYENMRQFAEENGLDTAAHYHPEDAP